MKGLDLNFCTSSIAQPARTYDDMLQTIAAIKAALPERRKTEFLFLLSPDLAEQLKTELPEVLELENVRIDTLGVVSAGRYLKLPDMRCTSFLDLPLDIKP